MPDKSENAIWKEKLMDGVVNKTNIFFEIYVHYYSNMNSLLCWIFEEEKNHLRGIKNIHTCFNSISSYQHHNPLIMSNKFTTPHPTHTHTHKTGLQTEQQKRY